MGIEFWELFYFYLFYLYRREFPTSEKSPNPRVKIHHVDIKHHFYRGLGQGRAGGMLGSFVLQ